MGVLCSLPSEAREASKKLWGLDPLKDRSVNPSIYQSIDFPTHFKTPCLPHRVIAWRSMCNRRLLSAARVCTRETRLAILYLSLVGNRHASQMLQIVQRGGLVCNR